MLKLLVMFPTQCPICKQESLEYNDDETYCPKCLVYRKRLNIVQRQIIWARKRKYWGWRIAILLWFVVVLVQNIIDNDFSIQRTANPLSLFDFGIHELGHALFSFLGDFIHILGGSLFQLLFPLIVIAAFLQQKWYYAAALCWCWLGISLFDVATYVADARARLLPLAVGPAIFSVDMSNPDAAYDRGHDWYQLLSRTGLLDFDLSIAFGIRVAAVIAFVIGFILAGFLLWHMAVGTKRRQSAETQAIDLV